MCYETACILTLHTFLALKGLSFVPNFSFKGILYTGIVYPGDILIHPPDSLRGAYSNSGMGVDLALSLGDGKEISRGRKFLMTFFSHSLYFVCLSVSLLSQLRNTITVDPFAPLFAPNTSISPPENSS